MNARKTIATVALAVLAIALTISVGKMYLARFGTPQAALIGKWQNADNRSLFLVFGEKREVAFVHAELKQFCVGTYQQQDAARISVKFQDTLHWRLDWQVQELRVTVSADRLQTTDAKGISENWRRVNEIPRVQ